MITTEEQPFPFSDPALARRLERAEAQSAANFVETRARVFPESGARWIEVAGAYAMYDGVKSPSTQTFRLGLFDTVGRPEMEAIEEFYRGVQLAISRNEEIRMRLIQANEQEVWARTAAKGWSEFTERG